MNCPFCTVVGFDLVGLKYHLQNYCAEYDSTVSPSEELAQRRLANIERITAEIKKIDGKPARNEDDE